MQENTESAEESQTQEPSSINECKQGTEAHQERQEEVAPWTGYAYPLACRVIRKTDAIHLYPVMKRSASSLKGYIGWAQYSPSWDLKTVQKFVSDHVESEWPRFHLIFTIGYEVVGFGSLAPVSSLHPRDVQVALWVAKGHERRGIGSWIVTVLEWYAFNVFGYDHVYYQHDASNRKSGALPKRLGYKYSHSFDSKRAAVLESGLWLSWVKDRPTGLAPGAIDTGTLDNWLPYRLPWKCLI